MTLSPYARMLKAALKRFLFRFWPIFLGLLLLLAGCDGVHGISLPTGFPVIPGMASPTPTSTATPAATATPVPDLTPSPTPVRTMVLWVPPQFAPDSSTPAGKVLAKRLADFSRLNGGIQVQVRIKAEAGPSSLLESLSAASAAAPLVLPSVVALNQADLESAALKGLIFSLDESSKVINDSDWYAYARSLARVQGATFSLPFAGDALILAYRPNEIKLNTPLADWTTVLRMNQALGFPAGDPQALVVLSLYMSTGGTLTDAQRRPALQADKLAQVLQIFADGSQRAVFPYWLSQYETNGQVRQAYKDGRLNAMLTWTSDYLSAPPTDTTIVPVPPLGKTPQTMATGWGWAVAEPDIDQRAESVKLAEYLTASDFLAEWTEAAGYLPTRPSVLAAWNNRDVKVLLDQVATSAQTRPPVDEVNSLGPVLRDALLTVLKSQTPPEQAAKDAVNKLAVPETQ